MTSLLSEEGTRVREEGEQIDTLVMRSEKGCQVGEREGADPHVSLRVGRRPSPCHWQMC